MRFYLQLHGTLPLEAYPRLAGRAEELGFQDVAVHDRLLRRPVWPLLCDIARATSRVLVGPDVTHPYLAHPVSIAANLRHLDELSGGRAVLGIGRGSQYELVGRPAPAGTTGLREAIELIRRLTTGDRGALPGEEFPLAEGLGLLFGEPRRIPVYVGAFGPAGARLAGRVADGIRTAGQWDPAYMTRVRAWVREAAERAGRDPDEIHVVAENWTCLAPDRQQARTVARHLLAQFLPGIGPMVEFYRVPAEEVAAAKAVAAGDKEALAGISDATVDRFMAAGDATDLRVGLDRLADAGLDSVSFSGVLGPNPAAALEMLGAELASRRARDAARTRPRVDLYRNIHKGQRARLYSLATRAGTLDADDRAAVRRLREDVAAMLAELHEHVEQEDRLIHPLLRERAPEAAGLLDREHARLDPSLDELEPAIARLDAPDPATVAEAALALYRALSRYIAAYLEHLDHEEQVAMPALWQTCSDDELAEVRRAYLASRVPAERVVDLRKQLPALTPQERVQVARLAIGGPVRSAEELLDQLTGVMDSADLARLRADLAGPAT